MNHKGILLLICLVLGSVFAIQSLPANADDDHKKKQNQAENHSDHALKSPVNPVYESQCGACHLAYPAQFLPESSWTTLLTTLEDHFGESVELDAGSQKIIMDYLKSNSADHSATKRAGKIMKGLGNPVPLRITQIPYIIKKHHEISQDILDRESIGSLSNCSACHTTAEDGIYDDDNIKIPK